VVVVGGLGQTPKSGAKSPLDPGQPQTSNTTGNWQVRDFYETGARGGGVELFHREIVSGGAGTNGVGGDPASPTWSAGTSVGLH
jgi:hypothetical protein